jgi:hypothetical protein
MSPIYYVGTAMPLVEKIMIDLGLVLEMTSTAFPCRICGFPTHSEHLRGFHEARAHKRRLSS